MFKLQNYLVSVVLLGCALGLCGCHRHISITTPEPPTINPSDYTPADYNADLAAYKAATSAGTGFNPDIAKQKRNEIVYGLMGQIDVVYGDYYRRLFSGKNAVTISNDALTLGLSTASTIAANSATKTILSALGTGFAGLGLSIDKNYFSQQAFPVIGVAMQTRRDKVRSTIISNLTADATVYPLLAAKRDLIEYFNAGTLPSGLQELQEEAGAATATSTANTGGTNKPAAPAGFTAAPGNGQASLVWEISAGATSYNLYYSTTTGVTPATGTKISGITTNSYTHSGLTNETTYFYVVTAVNASGESGPSVQASATPAAPPAATGPPSAPLRLSAAAGNAQASLVWEASAGATSYNLYYSTNTGVTPASGTKISGITTNSYTHSGLTNGTTYFYVVTAVNASGESGPSVQASTTPSATPHAEPNIIKVTPH